MITREGRDKTAWSLRSSQMVLSALLVIFSRCYWKFNLVSKSIPKCFWEGDCFKRLWLKYIEPLFRFWGFLGNITSWACLVGWGLKLVFHYIALSLILLRLLFKLFADLFRPWTTEKRDVSFVNSLTFFIKSSERSLI